MTIEQIEAFFSVVKHGSLIKASESLYVTQPTLSHRIADLEKEFGAPLLVRKKGVGVVELTPLGRRFLPLAEKWNHLYLETIRTMSINAPDTIFISGTSSLISTLVLDVSVEAQKTESSTKFSVVTVDYSDMYKKIDSGEVDFSFLIFPMPSITVDTIPVAYEELVLVCSTESKLPSRIKPSTLDPTLEIYMNWSADYHFWHEHNFGVNSHPLVQTSLISSVDRFINEFDAWAIFPRATAEYFASQGRIRICQLSPAPPRRLIYLAYSKASPHPHCERMLDMVRTTVEHHRFFEPV